MNTAPLRSLVAYAATGAFFSVAALCELQGQTIADVAIKAGAALIVAVALGLAVISIVESAARTAVQKAIAAAQGAEAEAGPATEKGLTAPNPLLTEATTPPLLQATTETARDRAA